jgi:glycyl-tRNA synthetase beta chain
LLVGCFHLGLVPTPTKDPYALRRAALGSLRILAAAASNDDPLARVKVSDLVKKGIAGYRTVQMDAAGVEREVMEFLAGRLRNWLTADHSTEVVDACLAAKRPPGVEHEADFPYDVVRKVEAIETLRGRPDYEPLVIAFKRVVNITKGTVPGTFDPARVSAAEERALWEAFCAVRSALVARLDSREFPAALSLLIELKPHVDRYFDAVLVMCDDEAERNNHLAMLGIIGDLFLRLSDFTRILA